MSKLTRRKFLAATSAVATGVSAFGILTRPGDAAEFTWRYANNNVPTHPMNIRAGEAIAKIKEQSGGRLDIQLFPNGAACAIGADQIRYGMMRFVSCGVANR